MFENKSILVIDCETTSRNSEEAILKWVGMYSYKHNKHYLLDFSKDKKEVIELLKEHKVHVGFNFKAYDKIVLTNNLQLTEDIFEYKVIVDLYEISAPKSGKNYGMFNKNRLAQMGIRLKNFSLKKIVEELKLDKDIGTKGEIDYTIFLKDTWTPEEEAEIKKYLKQDIDLTKLLLEWYHTQFEPLKKFLPQKEQDNLLYIKSSLASLAYNIICNKAGLPVVFGEKDPGVKEKAFEGGHHIEPRKEIVVGNLLSVDVVSMYPNCLLMGNLNSPVNAEEEGWSGDNFFQLEGKYNTKELGKVGLALKEIFLERLKAKKEGDKPKDKSYKVIINSFYGLVGSPVFKSVYNRNTASDTTSMARTILKKACKTLDENGFEILSGFTDSIYLKIPPHLSKEHAMLVIDDYMEDVKKHVPFPMDTFVMACEEEIKMIWFVTKNCYLWVTNKNEVKYKSTLLNTNTPASVMKLFETYMRPKIVETLSIPFTKTEIEEQIKIILEREPSLATQEYKVGELEDYKVKSSLQYQISEKYGAGRHFLIPNRKGVGVGLAKSTKKQAGLRYCSMEDFKEKNLKTEDIDLKHLLSHLKPFYERNEKKEEHDNSIQRQLL